MDRLSNQDQPPLQKREISRRDFLRVTALSVASWALGGAVTPASPTSGEQVGPAAKGQSESLPLDDGEIVFDERGVKVWADSSGVPVRWLDASGETGVFDRSLIDEAKQKIRSEENRLLTGGVYRVSAHEHPWVHLQTGAAYPERVVNEMPQDTLSTEVLRAYGIHIIQPPSVSLFLRPDIFSNGGLLDSYIKGGGKRLDIVLVDAPTLTPEAFADDRYIKYQSIVAKQGFNLPTSLSHPHMIAEMLRNNAHKGDDFNQYNTIVKAQAYAGITPEEMIHWGLVGGRGYMLPQGHKLGFADRSVIFMPIPIKEPPQGMDALSLRVVASGDEVVVQPEIIDIRFDEFDIHTPLRRVLRRGQSYPHEEDFPLNTRPQLSKFAAHFTPESKTPGFVMRHELAHDRRLNNPSGNPTLDHHEGETDLTAMASIRRAQEKLAQGDDSGYSLVFQNNNNGDIIVT